MKEWTLMFYFASDNALAPEIVSQLKSIKNAGYHHEVNVVAYFDPQPAGTPAHIFDVNAIYKLQHPHDNDIGFASDDPYVRSLMDDRLWGKEKDRDGETIRQRITDRLKKKGITYSLPPVTSDQAAAEYGEKSLRSFLDFCACEYRAKHYMLFILGHGLVVGDDVFLFDEHAAKRSVTLRDLGEALEDFKTKIGEAKFELVSFHSCSMSSLEVAFQLQGTANYMLASQGPAFVNSWPYRQILIRVFNEVAAPRLKTPEEIDDKNVKESLLKDIFSYVYYNSTDYLLAGYTFDLCLCDLRQIGTLRESIRGLSRLLVKGLTSGNNSVKYSILLAHWASQSYFQENYTDLYDFCSCLRRYCKDFEASEKMLRIDEACEMVMIALEKQNSNHRKSNPIIKADCAGPDSQYSHGLSVYFPWARPTADRTIIKDYKEYKFSQTEWFGFLNQYWGDEKGTEKDLANSTMRDSYKNELAAVAGNNRHAQNPESREKHEYELKEDIASIMFNVEGALNTYGSLNSDKPNGQVTTGDGCTCGSIKNYRRDTRARRDRGKCATKEPTYPIKQRITGI